jgi:O-antigen biosynthesis protein
MRQLGLRVLYQAHSAIYHLEGISHGRDESSGVKSYQAKNAHKFFERWRDTLLSHRENGQQPRFEANRSARHRILIVEACMITPDQDSGSIRMFNLLKILKEENCGVTFLADNLEGTEKYRQQLESLGVEVVHGAWAGTTRRFLRERGSEFDTIVFCRHYIASPYIDTVRVHAPNARIVFDTVDLHYLREEREAKLLNNSAMLASAAATRSKEIALVRKCDVTLVVSDVEKTEIALHVPEARVEVVSNIHIPKSASNLFDDRKGILFVGGFRHPPNADAILWYAADVMPHLTRLLPGVVTHVVGSNVTDAISALHSDALHIHGYVENIEPLLEQTKVSIAPLRYGAGVKGKVNEAMNYGIPVVATSCAVEGMHVTHESDVLIADDPEAFARAIARIYSDSALWVKLADGGRKNIQTHFSIDAARATVLRALFA